MKKFLGLFEGHYLDGIPPKVENFFKHQMVHPQRYGKTKEYADLVEDIIANPMLNGNVIKYDSGFRLNVI